jgi:hypothetical protein
MPEISISEKTHARLVEFKPVIEAVLEQEISVERCVEFTVGMGIDATLSSLMESMDQGAFLRMFQALGSKHPNQVYPYITETVKRGAVVRQREAMKRRLSQTLAEDTDTETD